MRTSCHVGACTPFVIAMISDAPSTSCHIARDTSPWSCDTPFERRDSRRPATVMLNGSPPICSISPSTRSHVAPRRRSSPIGCTSLPAATGVCVVKTI
jgi:hypothetical protein